ncbi:MAG: L,D-transpeptidase [Flexilinea sp.]
MNRIIKFFHSFFLTGILLLTAVQQSYAQESTVTVSPSASATQTEEMSPTATAVPAQNLNNNSDILCYPDSYQIDPEICNPLGPSEYLTELAKNGLSYPSLPFTVSKIDDALSTVPYQYAKLNIENWETVPLYSTAEEAIAGTNPSEYMAAGSIRYVSFTNRVDSGSAHFVQSKQGYWLRASPAAVTASTLGRTFTHTPSQYFGWVFEASNPYLKPDYNGGMNEAVWHNREDVLQVYDVIEDKNTTWFQVGENEWLDRIHFRAALFNTTPPEGIEGGRWIEVDLYQQVLMVYDNYSLVYAAMIATGMKPFYTRPGIFQIYEKKESEDMTGAFESDKSDYYYLEDVPFTMYFDQARAFHGAYWRAWYGYEQSHGCVNMSIGDAHWLYNWAETGDYAYIHDPSGITPTDPAYYGAGGA